MLIIPIVGTVVLVVVLVFMATVSSLRAIQWIAVQSEDLDVRRELLGSGEDGFSELTSYSTQMLSMTKMTRRRYSLALEITSIAKDQFVATRGRAYLGELGSLIHDRINRHNLFSRQVGAALVFIALLGTLLGLQTAVGHLAITGDLKNSNDITQFVSRSRQVLGEFSIAFWATIAGVIGTIEVFAVDYMFKRRAGTLVETFDLFLHVDVLPYLARHYPLAAAGESGQMANTELMTTMARTLPAAAAELLNVTRGAAAAAEAASNAALNSQLATETLQRAFASLSSIPEMFSGHLSELSSAHERMVVAHAEWTHIAGTQTAQLTDTVMRQGREVDRGLSLLGSIAETTASYARQVEILGNKLAATFAALEVFGPKADSTLASLQHFQAMTDSLATNLQSLQREIREHGIPSYIPGSGDDGSRELEGVSERLGELTELLRARPVHQDGYAVATMRDREVYNEQEIAHLLANLLRDRPAGTTDAAILQKALSEAVRPIETRLREVSQSSSEIRRTLAYMAGRTEPVQTKKRRFTLGKWWGD